MPNPFATREVVASALALARALAQPLANGIARPMGRAWILAAMSAFAALPNGAAGASMQPISGDPVATTGGALAGTRLPSGVKAYLGVPYARPPTGDLRWRAPEPFAWAGVWNADRKGPECIQVLRPHDINHYFGEEASGEDCLTLNVWVPADSKPGERRPVIVFIYGGGGTIGSSGMANYDGENVAKRGAVFVNFNYRVGLLGFMAHPELTKEQGGSSGNYGFLDQNAALRWIRDNVAAFGGDPAQVVITGQSFGATSVAAQMTTPLSKGLFRGAVLMSACNLAGGGVPLAEAEAVGIEVQKRLGASDLAALRNVPADRILAQQAESQVGVNVRGVRASPVVDGRFWHGTREQALASEASSSVPIVATSNGDDLDALQSPFTKLRTATDYAAKARELYGDAAAEFLKWYPAPDDAAVAPAAHAVAAEGGMLASSRKCADLLAANGKPPAYLGLFTRKHPYAAGVKFADQDPATVGAYHTADVPYWFDTMGAYNRFRTTRVPSAWDRELTDRMVGALIAFARTGSPSTSAMPWPAYSAREPKYLELGDATVVRPLPVKRMDWLAAHPLSPDAKRALGTAPRD